jgi:hypothetical protein
MVGRQHQQRRAGRDLLGPERGDRDRGGGVAPDRLEQLRAGGAARGGQALDLLARPEPVLLVRDDRGRAS